MYDISRRSTLHQSEMSNNATRNAVIAQDNQSPTVDSIIKINVGGIVYQCFQSTLQAFPDSKLAKLDCSHTSYNCSTNEYFFDRNPWLFSAILDAYRKGSVHVPKDICGSTFKSELEFWELSPGHVAPCCWETLYSSDDDIIDMNKIIKNMQKNTYSSLLLEDEKPSMRLKLWLILDEPGSSRFAFLWGLFISVLIAASMLLLAMKTLPQLWETYTDDELKAVYKMMSMTGMQNFTDMRNTKANRGIRYADIGCHAVLTAEIIIYFLVCPYKRKLLSCWLLMIAVVGYLAFCVALIMEFYLDKLSERALTVYTVVAYMSILKILRLFYITRDVPAFKLIGMTFTNSKPELKILVFLLSILVCLFGFTMYIVEMTLNDKIDNAFNAMYWALITLTTVGYGDYTPVTTSGHVVASACAVCGVLVLAMPVGVIASTFYSFYRNHKYATKHMFHSNRELLKETNIS